MLDGVSKILTTTYIEISGVCFMSCAPLASNVKVNSLSVLRLFNDAVSV
jgi:hypothetical protein